MDKGSFLNVLRNTKFDLRVLRSPSQIEIASSLFRKFGDYSKTVSFTIEEEGQLDNGNNHVVSVVVTGVEQDNSGFFGQLPDMYIFGYCNGVDGEKFEISRDFIPVKIFLRQRDGFGRFYYHKT